jgi:hypothetical protein
MLKLVTTRLSSLAFSDSHAAKFAGVWIRRTANQLEAELVDLVESMAAATKRNVKWVGGRIAQGPTNDSLDRISERKPSRLSCTGLAPRRVRCSGTASPAASGDTQSGVCIVHEPDAHEHALRLQEGILRLTQTKQCYIGGPASNEDMQGCFERIARSSCAILVQTRSVLMHPWPLLATYYAALAEVPLICVVVDEGGYDFGRVEHHLGHLNERLDAAALEQMSSVMSGWTPKRTVAELQSKLFNFIPQIISVTYNPSGTRNKFAATISDINDKQGMMRSRFRRRIVSTEEQERFQRHQAQRPPGTIRLRSTKSTLKDRFQARLRSRGVGGEEERPPGDVRVELSA